MSADGSDYPFIESRTQAPFTGLKGVEDLVTSKGLELLRRKLGARFKAGIVIYSGEHTLPVADRIWAVPLSGLWQ